MTGATSGLGKVAALYSAGLGANLTVLARDKKKAEKLIAEFKLKFPADTGSISYVEGDLNSFASVVSACNNFKSKANQADMQKIVVHMKDELEKIKEQLANVL